MLIEGVVRSVNNLLEKFHQSFFLYFLTAPNKFVSVGVYMIAFALLVAPLPIVASALFSGSRQLRDSTDTASQTTSSAGAEEAAWWTTKMDPLCKGGVYGSPLGSLSLITTLPYLTVPPYFLNRKHGNMGWTFHLNPTHLLPDLGFSRDEWKLLKAVTITAACTSLGLMSIINFSTAQFGAMLLVPMSLMVRPLRNTQGAVGLRAMLVACNLTLGLVGFLPAALMILKGLFEGFGKVDIGDFWQWAEFLWAWNSGTCLYLLLVHLPCWVLCIHILLHP